MSKTVTRRQFLQTTAAATAGGFAAGCGSEPAKTPSEIAQAYQASSPAPAPDNLYSILSSASFTDQDGNHVSTDGLKAKYANRFTTLTFGFGSCDFACPAINGNLGKLSKKYPDMASIVVSVDPEMDNSSQSQRDHYRNTLRGLGLSKDVTILYPNSSASITELAHKAGATAIPGRPKSHDSNIVLFAPGGKKIATKGGMDSFDNVDAAFGQYLSGSIIKK